MSEVEFRNLRQSVQDAIQVRPQTETSVGAEDSGEELADDLEHSDVLPDSPSISEAPITSQESPL